MIGLWASLTLAAVSLRGDVSAHARELAREVFTALDGDGAWRDVTITVTRDASLRPQQEGASVPGVIRLRVEDDRVLRHELAHQWLWSRCATAAEDHLFHEALAMAVAGEVTDHVGEALPSLLAARQRLQSGVSLDSRAGRSALRRVLLQWPGQRWPRAVERRLAHCNDTRWQATVVDDLLPPSDDASVFVLWDRATQQVVVEQGPTAQAFAVGSTLKPFVVAGHERSPWLTPDPQRGEWQCGASTPARVDVVSALARSCNGYFLDWERALGTPLTYGDAEAWLRDAGLVGEARSVRDAIGFTRAVTISPRGLARAYDTMLHQRPEMYGKLSRVFSDGTLHGARAGALFEAGKSGTVRDAFGGTELGWVVLIGPRWLAVRGEPGTRPVRLVDDAVARSERYLRRLRDTKEKPRYGAQQEN